MPVNPDDVLRVTAKMTLHSGDIQNVYHLQNQGSAAIPDETALSGLAQYIDSAHEELQTLIASGLTFDSIDVYNLTQDYLIGNTPWTTLEIGGDGGASDVYTPQGAALVKFLTNTARSQGRKYIGGLTEANIGGVGFLIPTAVVKLLNYASEILLPPVLSGQQMEIGNWNEVLSRFVGWTAGQVAAQLGTQRRRRTGVGS
jgi:hypothetical protein